MLRGRFYLVIIALMFCAFYVEDSYAQPLVPEEIIPEDMDYEDGRKYLIGLLDGLMHDHDRIKAAEERVISAKHQIRQSWSGWTPSIDASIEGGREEIDKPGGGTNKYRNEEKLTATQLLYDFGGASGNIDRAKAILKESQASLEQVRQELMIQGIAAYLGLIRARETLKYAIQSENNIKRLSGMEEALVDRGAELSYKELQIKAQLAGSMSYRVTVERQLESARNRFKSVFGYPISTNEIYKLNPVGIPGISMPASLEDAIDTAYDQNPQLVQLLHAKERLKSEVDVQESTLYPRFDFVVEGKRREQDQGADGVRLENKATFQMSYSAFSGLGEYEGTQVVKANLRELNKQTRDVRRTVEENVRNVWVELMTLRKNADLYRNQADITWKFLELIKKKRSMGESVELLDILVGERDYISATSASVTADIDNITCAYRLLYEMGVMNLGVLQKSF